MAGLHAADIAVIVAYLVGITALGVWMARRVKSSGDFFMPRRFGKAMMITNAFGTGTASDQAVTVASGTFTNGVSGIWWQWLWLLATPFYWLIAPIMRRLRAVTTADVYSLRYDRSVAMLFAVVGIYGLAVKIGLMLVGAGALVYATTDGAISSNMAIAMITVMFVLYGTAGGLGAAIVTDFFQGILTIIFSVMLLPFILNAVGGLEGVHSTITDKSMLSLAVPGEIGYFFVIMYGIQALVGIVAQPFIMGVCASGRTEMDGRVGFMVGNIVKRLCTMAWCVTALAAVAWYMQRGVDLTSVEGDHVYGDVARAFLPAGLLGLFIASLLASVMSSCDAFMISSAGLFTENLYKPIKTGRSPGHYLTVGRITSLLVVVGALLFVWYVKQSADAEGKSPVIKSLKIWFKIAPMMGITFWLGLLWRRASVAGAWAATITGFASWWITTRAWFVDLVESFPLAESLGAIWREGDKAQIYEPWVIVFYLSAALIVGIVVSLLTPKVPEEKLKLFYHLTRTPVVEGEVVSESCSLPEGVTPPERAMLCTAFGLEVPKPSGTSVAGFIAGWLAVAALIGGFVWLMS